MTGGILTMQLANTGGSSSPYTVFVVKRVLECPAAACLINVKDRLRYTVVCSDAMTFQAATVEGRYIRSLYIEADGYSSLITLGLSAHYRLNRHYEHFVCLARTQRKQRYVVE